MRIQWKLIAAKMWMSLPSTILLGIGISSINLLVFSKAQAFHPCPPGQKSSHTGLIGEIPLCVPNPTPRKPANSSNSCLGVVTSEDYNFRIVNFTNNLVVYSINNQEFSLNPGYFHNFSYPAIRGTNSCNRQSYELPIILFDNSYYPGYQATSYKIGDRREYRFEPRVNGLDLLHND